MGTKWINPFTHNVWPFIKMHKSVKRKHFIEGKLIMNRLVSGSYELSPNYASNNK